MAKAAKKAKAELPMMIVASKVKEVNKEAELQTSGDFIDALNEKVANLIDAAQARATDNGRKTVRPSDL